MASHSLARSPAVPYAYASPPPQSDNGALIEVLAFVVVVAVVVGVYFVTKKPTTPTTTTPTTTTPTPTGTTSKSTTPSKTTTTPKTTTPSKTTTPKSTTPPNTKAPAKHKTPTGAPTPPSGYYYYGHDENDPLDTSGKTVYSMASYDVGEKKWRYAQFGSTSFGNNESKEYGVSFFACDNISSDTIYMKVVNLKFDTDPSVLECYADSTSEHSDRCQTKDDYDACTTQDSDATFQWKREDPSSTKFAIVHLRHPQGQDWWIAQYDDGVVWMDLQTINDHIERPWFAFKKLSK